MRRSILLAAALSAACSPKPRRAFHAGFLGPLSPRLAAEAGRLGFDVSERPPTGAVIETAAVPDAMGGASEVTADWAKLRFLAARAAARGASGLYFRLSRTSAGRDLLDYPEEWQAPARVLRELLAVKPVLEGGAEALVPFAVPAGIEARAWTYLGRRYVLLVNSSGADAPLDADVLVPWRALFEVRSDARQLLNPCREKLCLPPERVLWLEGHLL